MSKTVKILLIVISVFLITGIVIFQLIDEPLPEGKEGPRAEQMAYEMLLALNKEAYDSLEVLSWSYPPGHKYTWYKNEDSVVVNWDEITVYLNTFTKKGTVVKEGAMSKKDSLEYIQEAYEYFINDSFWLIAPYKVRDPGTNRKLVDYRGKDALLVTYSSGGVTPGDSYLWILDEENKPKSWKFWVQILPIGGIEFSWEEWENINGALISTLHKGPIDLEITNLEGE